MNKYFPRVFRAFLTLIIVIIAGCGAENDNDAAATEQLQDTEEGASGDADPSGGQPLVAEDEPASAAGHDHDDGVEVPQSMAVPELSIEVTPDAIAGQNLDVTLTNLRIAPEHASTDPVDGEGHLHLYVDGERVMRFYNEWLHLSLEPGDHIVEVEVSSNSHSPYTVEGQPVRALVEVAVAEPGEGVHTHATSVEVDQSAAPLLVASVTADPKSGWNVHVDVDRLRFAPEHVSSDPVDGEGHLHLYIDGVKITRLYGPWWHIPELSVGPHEIMVEASANDHSPYTVDGTPVTSTVEVTVSAEQGTAVADEEGSDHDHDHDDEAPENATEGPLVEDVDVVIDIELSEGEIAVSDDRIQIDVGDSVAIVVTADVAEEVHVHGYDHLLDVVAGETATVTFVADVPGIFEVEFEQTHALITELEVR